MHEGLRDAGVLVLAVPSMVLLAKVHGRQVRLWRELHGFFDVTFGPRASNPPEVEAMWRRDRWRFWPTTTLALCALLVSFYLLRENVFLYLAAIPWAMMAGFTVAGVLAWDSRARDLRRLGLASKDDGGRALLWWSGAAAAWILNAAWVFLP